MMKNSKYECYQNNNSTFRVFRVGEKVEAKWVNGGFEVKLRPHVHFVDKKGRKLRLGDAYGSSDDMSLILNGRSRS